MCRFAHTDVRQRRALQRMCNAAETQATTAGGEVLVFSATFYQGDPIGFDDSAYTPIVWKNVLRIDSCYEFTAGDSAVTVTEDGFYVVYVNFEYVDSHGDILLEVEVSGTPPFYAKSRHPITAAGQSASIQVPLVLTAGQTIRVSAKATAGGTDNEFDAEGSRITILHIRDAEGTLYPDTPPCADPYALSEDARVGDYWLCGNTVEGLWTLTDPDVNGLCCCDDDATITLEAYSSKLEQFDPPGGALYSTELITASVPDSPTGGLSQAVNGFARNDAGPTVECGISIDFWYEGFSHTVDNTQKLAFYPMASGLMVDCGWNGFGPDSGDGSIDYSFDAPLHIEGAHPRSLSLPQPKDYPKTGTDGEWVIVDYRIRVRCDSFTAHAVWEKYSGTDVAFRVTVDVEWSVT